VLFVRADHLERIERSFVHRHRGRSGSGLSA
jgi:hypothetical protein